MDTIANIDKGHTYWWVSATEEFMELEASLPQVDPAVIQQSLERLAQLQAEEEEKRAVLSPEMAERIRALGGKS